MTTSAAPRAAQGRRSSVPVVVVVERGREG